MIRLLNWRGNPCLMLYGKISSLKFWLIHTFEALHDNVRLAITFKVIVCCKGPIQSSVGIIETKIQKIKTLFLYTMHAGQTVMNL